jgi:hypothetical protein
MSAYTRIDSASTDVETLEAICDWKESLQRRIRLARTRYELVGSGASREAIIALSAEVEEYKRLCRTVMGVIRHE